MPTAPERRSETVAQRPSVLHVLARPGGGGEQYFRMLAEGLPDFEHAECLLTHRATPIKGVPPEALRGLPSLRRRAAEHQILHFHGAPALLLSLPVVGVRPTIFTTHGLSLLRSGAPRRWLIRIGLRRALARGARALAVSEADRDSLLAVEPRFAASTTVVRSGVPQQHGDPADRTGVRHEWRVADSTVVFLFVGELSTHKQPAQLVEAMRLAKARGSDVAGILIGDGPLRPTLESRGHGIVSLLGERDEIESLLGGGDVFVMPSTHEGMPLALLEAMASGLAVIASDIPSHREAVGDAGTLTPVGDVGALSRAIVDLAEDHDLRQRLGAAARERASARFALNRMLRETAVAYSRALADV